MINKIMTKEEYKKVYEAEKAIVVFSAEWCDACHRLLDKLEDQIIDNSIKVFNVDVDECEDLAEEYSIKGLPTVILYKGTSVECRFESAGTVQDFLDILE